MKYDQFLQFDVRLQEKNIETGVLTPKELEKHLNSLPDVADKGEAFIDEEIPQEQGKSETEVEENAREE